MDGLREGRCLDGDSLDPQPGGPVHVYPCTKRWHQYLSFGNGKEVPFGSLHTTVPLHTRRRISETGRTQEAYMCLGVAGRGDGDEEDWLGRRRDDEEEHDHESTDEGDLAESDDFSVDGDESPYQEEHGTDGLSALRKWKGDQLVATRCSNTGAIIEWVVVPFIEEDESDHAEDKNASATINEEGDKEL